MSEQESVKTRKEVPCDELSRALSDELSRILSKQVIPGEGSVLEGYVRWSLASGSNNERGWDVVVLHIKNLDIEITDSRDESCSNHEVEIRYGVSNMSASLHFDSCRFFKSNIGETGIKFIPEFDDPYIGESLSFARSTGNCSFSFPGRSSVVFEKNNFSHVTIKSNDIDKRKWISLEFKENRFMELNLDFPFPFRYPISCRFIGGNEVNVLKWDQMVNRRKFDHHGDVVKYDDVQEYTLLSISFDRNEKIGWRLLDTCYVRTYVGEFYYMKDLFVRLKNLAHMRNDIDQENTIASYISLVEYAEVKNSKWYKSWRGLQNWLLLGWRWTSSRFYMSWIRPISLLLLGYFIINSIPLIWARFGGMREVSWETYLNFCTYTPAKIFFYADSLKDVLDNCTYTIIEREFLLGEVGLNIIGIFRLVWIWLCGAAFRNAIKTYSSK